MNTDQIAVVAGVEPATVRSWMARAPAFEIGVRDGRTRVFTPAEAATLLVAGHILRHRNARPHLALPAAARINAMTADIVFVDVAPGGATHVARDADLLPSAIAINLTEIRRAAGE
ncbi:hypothetical protein J2Y63_005394 [Shinella sp. BE166]|uniref:hypothetical protein n=1 Tax=Shinella sp. BE166 TaxID=3373918 RepID=UPI003EBAFA4E